MAKLPWKFLELWPGDYFKACEWSGQCSDLEGRSDSGNDTSKRSKETQPNWALNKNAVGKRHSDGPA